MGPVVVIIGYFLGSFLPAVLVIQYCTGKTPWEIDENPGAAGAWRVGGPFFGIVTGVFDVLKGIIPVSMAHRLGLDGFWFTAAACAPVIGHNWSIFYRFQGGRGLSTATGVLLRLSWNEMAPACVVGIIAGLITKWTPMVGIVGFPLGLILMLIVSVDRQKVMTALCVVCVSVIRQIPWLVGKVSSAISSRDKAEK